MGICGSQDKMQIIIPKKYNKELLVVSKTNKDVIQYPNLLSLHSKQITETISSNISNYKKSSKNLNIKPTYFQFTHRTEENDKKSNNLTNSLIQNKVKMRNIRETNSLNQYKSNKNLNVNNYINIQNSKSQNFQRRKRKSISLVQKSKFGSKLIQEELKLEITNQSLVEEQSGNPYQKYKIINKTGEGAYGSVFSAINIHTGVKIAMKKILKIKENKVDDMEIKNEFDILKKLDHPNIVKIFEFYDSNSNYYIITEFCKYGELYKYIYQNYSERQLCVLFYQVFSGLCYLHENNIIHRDIKLENIMISDIEKDIITKEEYFWLKIIDFGTAKIFQKNKKEKTIIGSSYYIAPEVLKKQYNEKCDTWSIGVVLFMLITGVPPFDGKNDKEIIHSIQKGKYDKNNKKLLNYSKDVQDLLSKLLEVNVNKRLSSKEALNHSWFKNYFGRALYSNFNIDDIKIFIDNLMNYKFQSKFQQLVLAFLVHNIPYNEEIKMILKLFLFFNESGNCKLTKEELINGLYQFTQKDIVDNIIDEIFILLDGDNNGFIEYEEFLRACINKKNILSNENLNYAFKFIDKDKSGTVCIKKIMKVFQNNNERLEEIIKNSIKEVDRDNDGIINFDEFKELMLRVE